MAIGLVKDLTKIGVEPEVTEGTQVDPSAATSYIQPLDGFSISPSKELKERGILTSGYTAARPRVGQKSVSAAINTEMRASGLEGGQTDFHQLLKGLLGGNRSLAARETSGTTHTTSLINFADTSNFEVGDIVVVLESGAHHISPIISIVTNTSITLLVAASGAFSDAVEVAKYQTYYPSNTLSDYPTLSLSFYHGDEIKESAQGCRPVSMALSNFSTGEIASFDFSLEGIDFSEVDGSAPHTPAFDTGTPPLILSSCVYQDGSTISINALELSVENQIGFITSTCSPDGRISSRFSGKRSVTGKINPYKDDTSVANFTNFDNNTAFSLFAFSANPSGTAGEYELGSIVSFYMPTCVATTKSVADQDGVLIEDIEFTADGGEAGEDNEIYIGMC